MKLRINKDSIVVIGKWEIIFSGTKITFFGSIDEEVYPAIKFCKKTKNIIVSTNTNSEEIEKT
jgi:flavodoxin